MTQILRARRGEITPEMQAIAADEGLSPEEIRGKVAQGLIVIPKNKRRNTRPVGIGSPLRTKVNANVGTSVDWPHADVEVAKARSPGRPVRTRSWILVRAGSLPDPSTDPQESPSR